jgi:hypothetical protein
MTEGHNVGEKNVIRLTALVVLLFSTLPVTLQAQSVSDLRWITRAGVFVPLTSFQTSSLDNASLASTVAFAIVLEDSRPSAIGFRGGLQIAPGTRFEVRLNEEICDSLGGWARNCATSGPFGVVAQLFAGAAYRLPMLQLGGGVGLRGYHSADIKCPAIDGACARSSEFRRSSLIPAGHLALSVRSRAAGRAVSAEITHFVSRELDKLQHELSIGAGVAW